MKFISFRRSLQVSLACFLTASLTWAGIASSSVLSQLTRLAAAQETISTPATNGAVTNHTTAGERPINQPVLTPGHDDGIIARLVARILMRSHYLQPDFNDELSSKFLDQYLDMLDPVHLIFLQSDLNAFDKYRHTLDDLTLRDGDTSPADLIFIRYLQRIDEQVVFVNAFLKTNEFVFASDERYPLNRRTALRPKNMDEAKRLWGDRVRFEYLQEKLNDQKPEEIVKTITRRYARVQRSLKEFDDSDVLQVYISALAHVCDPHSDYMNRATMENFTIGMKLSLFGIGALLQSEDGYCIIKELTPGGPAEKDGRLKPNDKIIAVAQGDQEPVDVVDLKLSKVVDLIRGAKGTNVRLTIIPASASDPSVRRIISLIRDEVKLEEREAKSKLIDQPGPAKRRLGIIDLSSFYAETATAIKTNNLKSATVDVSRLLKKLIQEKVDGVILDLRRNGGGSLEEAIRMSGLFIKEGPIVQVKDHAGKIIVDSDPDPVMHYDGPLIVLTSRFSASASEIMAGALQDHGRALIVGDISTHGKGSVQQLLELNPIMRQFGLNLSEDPGALKITIRKFYLPKGASTQLKGVTPDIVLPSVNNYGDVGEGAIPNALGWDEIKSAIFEPLNWIQPVLPELKKRSETRVAKDQDFSYMSEEIKRYRKSLEEKIVSLNEEQRRQEKKEADARLKTYKKEIQERPDPGEKVYEITLKQVDLPGLPPPMAKTNAVAKLQGHGPWPPGTSITATKATFATNATATAITNDASMGTASNPEAKTDEEEIPLVDATMVEAKRILNDLIELTASSQKRIETTSVVR